MKEKNDLKLSICIYFQVHQPFRIKRYRVFDIGNNHNYFDENSDTNINNRRMLQKVARQCYLPTNQLLLKLLSKYPGFKIGFSFSGTFLDQLECYLPEALSSFQNLVKTGRVEVLSETYYHSLAYLYSKNEFKRQVSLHKKKVKKLFDVTPNVFRNTELIYNNELAKYIQEMGFSGILAEGADHILGWRKPNFLYHPTGTDKIKLLLKNYKLSDDIAFRFSEKSWQEHPLTAHKFAAWLRALEGQSDIVNLFMDYETFGEHQWAQSGIFDFLNHLPAEILKSPNAQFVTPSEAVETLGDMGEIDMPWFVSWADMERDLSAWLSNPMQHDVLEKLYGLEEKVLTTRNKQIIEDWRKLQTSDHFYYMCTKWFNDGDVHKYFNPYETPYEAYTTYINVMHDLRLRVEKSLLTNSH